MSITLWRAPFEPKPEPCATLTYGDQTYHIPYTLMQYLEGWVAMGAHGSHAPVDAASNTLAALSNLNSAMGSDATPLTDPQIEFYASHNISTTKTLKPVRNYD